MQIDKIEQTLARSGRTLTVTPDALEQLVHEGYSLAYGARFLKRVIEIEDQAADQPALDRGHARSPPTWRTAQLEVDRRASVSELAATA